jgi:hypothetical protein
MATRRSNRSATPHEKGKGGSVAQIIVGVAIALIAGGSAPWWWNKVFPPKAAAVFENLESLPECPKGYFYLQSRATDLFLGVDETGRLVQADDNDTEKQIWVTVPGGKTGYCYLTTKTLSDAGREEYLEIKRGRPDDYPGLGRKRALNADDQQWTFDQVQPGYYVIISKLTGRAIDVPWGDPNKKYLCFFGPHKNNNQQWKLIPF